MELKLFSTKWMGKVTHWLIQEENQKFIDPVRNSKKLDPITFRKMCQRPEHKIFLYFNEQSKQPVGFVALSNIDPNSKTARLWYLVGEKQNAGQNNIARAVNECLRYGFVDLGLESIYAWTVSEDTASKQVLTNNHFNFIGKRRQCHPIDGRLMDRMLYDLLATEFLDYKSEPFNDFIAYKGQANLQSMSTS